MSTDRSRGNLKHEMLGYGIFIALVLVVIGIFSFFLSTLPGEAKRKGENVLVRYDKERQAFESARRAFAREQKAPYYATIASHEKNEAWPGYFETADATFGHLQPFDKEIRAILDRDDSKDASRLSDVAAYMNGLLKDINSTYRYPLQRLAAARDVLNDPVGRIAQDADVYDHARQTYDALQRRDAKTIPSTEAVVSRLLMENVEAAKQRVDAIDAERAGEAVIDVLDLHDASETIENGDRKLTGLEAGDPSATAELLSSRSVVLTDMKARYFIVPVRYSWNNASDYGDVTYRYAPVEIGYTQYQTLLKQEEVKLGTATRPNSYNRHNYCKVGGQPLFDKWERWTPGSTHAEYWIEKLYPRYYHRYAVFTDNRVQTTGWTEVPEKLFYRHLAHFGMQISSKPYGDLADETSTAVVPPAMTFVGNSLYGNWERDGETEFWQFTPEYDALFRPYLLAPHYTRTEYDGWMQSVRQHRDFYGITRRHGTYSPAVYRNPTYVNSDFVRLYIDMMDLHNGRLRYRGVLHEEASGGGSAGGSSYSARKSGRSLRGGGPGGFGK
jgi:hypothetical protein